MTLKGDKSTLNIQKLLTRLLRLQTWRTSSLKFTWNLQTPTVTKIPPKIDHWRRASNVIEKILDKWSKLNLINSYGYLSKIKYVTNNDHELEISISRHGIYVNLCSHSITHRHYTCNICPHIAPLPKQYFKLHNNGDFDINGTSFNYQDKDFEVKFENAIATSLKDIISELDNVTLPAIFTKTQVQFIKHEQ